MYKNKLIISKLSALLICLLSNGILADSIPVTNKFIKKGSTIKAGDLTNIELKNTAREFISNTSPLIGAFAISDIQDHTPIYPTQIKSPNLVSRNAIVDVLYSHNNITLNSKAIALQSAEYGQTVKLKNISNGKNIWGIVKDKNTVLIKTQ